jgi:hypothetical protein
MTFKPKRTAVALAEAIQRAMPDVPATTAPSAPGKPPPDLRTVQVNFRGSIGLARAIAKASEPYGGMRRFIAQLMRQAGYAVPDVDVDPPTTRRKYD